MEDLLSYLCQQSINKVMNKRKEEFKNVPLSEWRSKLQEQRIEAEVLDVRSVEAYIKVFNATYDVEAVDVNDLRRTSPKIGGILKGIIAPPNNLQFGIA